jgi:hypothetical protein
MNQKKVYLLFALAAMMILLGCNEKAENNATSEVQNNSSIVQDSSATVAIDAKTNLVWQDEMYVREKKNNDDEKIGNFKYAKEYCEKLNLASHDDWRLPNVDELKTVIDKKRKPAFNTIFKNAVDKRFVTSSLYMSEKNYIWVVDFNTGDPFGSHINNKNFIRCVRNDK